MKRKHYLGAEFVNHIQYDIIQNDGKKQQWTRTSEEENIISEYTVNLLRVPIHTKR